jgi:hypothetical protein
MKNMKWVSVFLMILFDSSTQKDVVCTPSFIYKAKYYFCTKMAFGVDANA